MDSLRSINMKNDLSFDSLNIQIVQYTIRDWERQQNLIVFLIIFCLICDPHHTSVGNIFNWSLPSRFYKILMKRAWKLLNVDVFA